jgi:hypothetical protein
MPELKREIRKIWAMKKAVEVIPIVVGACSNKLDNWIEKLGIHTCIRAELLLK